MKKQVQSNNWQQFVIRYSLFALLSWPQPAFAQVSFGDSLTSYVEHFYVWAIGAGLALAVIMLVYAGYLMIVSAGEPDKVGLAKEIIVGSLSGVALLAAARLVLNLLSAA